MKEISLFLMKSFSFVTIFSEETRKEKIYKIMIRVDDFPPEKYVVGKIYEKLDGTVSKICMDGPGFGIFNSTIANIILQEFSQNKSSFDFMKGLSCNIGFKKITLHNARVYKLIIIDHQLNKKVLGRAYKRQNSIVVVFDKPHFGILNPLIAEAISQEMLASEYFI